MNGSQLDIAIDLMIGHIFVNTSDSNQMLDKNRYRTMTHVVLTGVNAMKMKSFAYLFSGCTKLHTVIFSGILTGAITRIDHMFDGCINLTHTDFMTAIDTRHVTDASYLFRNCRSLDLTDYNFRTDNLVTAVNMFENNTSARYINISRWKTNKLEHIDRMFENCTSLIDISLPRMDHIKSLECMFAVCINLNSLDLNNINVEDVERFDNLFTFCKNMHSINLETWNTCSATSLANMFAFCPKLCKLEFEPNIDDTVDVTGLYYGTIYDQT